MFELAKNKKLHTEKHYYEVRICHKTARIEEKAGFTTFFIEKTAL